MIINAHLMHPFAKLWGNGLTSSSDGQFFRAAGRGAKRSDVNAHYSGDPGSKFYTWVSDQYGHFHILPMGATEDEAVYVLDGLYGHESKIDIDEHYVDTGGASEHVFGLFALAGKRIAPRLRDLKDRRLHCFEGADAYPAIKHHFGDRIDSGAIREGWDEALRAGVSVVDRLVAPSTLLKKLAALPKTNTLSRALREIPVGTGYAIWTGIGAVGAAIFGMIWLGEARTAARIASLLMIVGGIVALKLSTTTVR